MLLEVAYKTIAKIVHSRLVSIAEKFDHELQSGFHPRTGCADAVFTVKLAMKRRREHCNETWIIFLDLAKAFDRVPRDLLWIILERFGFPPKIITILKSLHKNVNVKFTVGTVTHILSSIIDVKQGDILGPILFTIFIAAIMITWRKMYDRPLCIFRTKKDFILTGCRSATKGIDFSLSDSEYADDTAVLFDARETLETFSPLLINHFLKNLERRSMLAIVTIQINTQKPKFCLFQLHHLLTPNLRLLKTEIYSLSTLAITGSYQ